MSMASTFICSFDIASRIWRGKNTVIKVPIRYYDYIHLYIDPFDPDLIYIKISR